MPPVLRPPFQSSRLHFISVPFSSRVSSYLVALVSTSHALYVHNTAHVNSMLNADNHTHTVAAAAHT